MIMSYIQLRSTMGFKEVKTGYRGSRPQETVDLSPVCATAWFDWKDANEEAEDRSCLFVSIEEGMLVIGGKNPIGVSVKDSSAFYPGAQKVALNGVVMVKSGVSSEQLSASTTSGKKLYASPTSGQLDTKRKFASSKRGFSILGYSETPGSVKVKVIL